MSDNIEQLVERFEGGGLTRRERVVALGALMVARPVTGGSTGRQV